MQARAVFESEHARLGMRGRAGESEEVPRFLFIESLRGNVGSARSCKVFVCKSGKKNEHERTDGRDDQDLPSNAGKMTLDLRW